MGGVDEMGAVGAVGEVGEAGKLSEVCQVVEVGKVGVVGKVGEAGEVDDVQVLLQRRLISCLAAGNHCSPLLRCVSKIFMKCSRHQIHLIWNLGRVSL